MPINLVTPMADQRHGEVEKGEGIGERGGVGGRGGEVEEDEEEESEGREDVKDLRREGGGGREGGREGACETNGP